MRYTRKRELIEEKRNPYKEVTTTTLNKLAAVLGVPPSKLIEEIKDEDKGDIA